MKIWNIIKEDFEGTTQLDENWKTNVLATVMGITSFLGNVKAQEKSNPSNVNVTQQVTNDSLRLDISKLFASGRYTFDTKDDAILKAQLQKFGKEVLKNPVSNFQIEIVSSESRVTNYDMDPQSPTYKQKLGVGELAKKRAETVNFILSNFTNELKNDGVLKGGVSFVQPKILIGDVAWPSVDPQTKQNRTNADPVYTKDQFVYVNIKIIAGKNAQADPYSVFASEGEIVHFNNHAYGMIFYPARQSNNQNQSGNLNTSQQNILLKTVNPNKALSGKKDEKGVYLKSYIIPYEWWNKNVFNKSLSQENIDYITSHFEAK